MSIRHLPDRLHSLPGLWLPCDRCGDVPHPPAETHPTEHGLLCPTCDPATPRTVTVRRATRRSLNRGRPAGTHTRHPSKVA